MGFLGGLHGVVVGDTDDVLMGGGGGNANIETYLMIRRMSKDVGAEMSWCQSTTNWQLLAMS